MAPTKQKWIWMWVAVVTSLSLLLSVGSSYSRLIDWASTELIYTPSAPAGYSSDCLSPSGQQILLSQWQPEETTRTLTISITRPVTEPSEPTPPETTVTEPSIPETTVPEPATPETSVPEATEPEATTPEATTPEATEPEATTPETTEPETTTPEEPVEEEPVQDPVEEEEPTQDPVEDTTADPVETVAEEPVTDDPSTDDDSTEDNSTENTSTEDTSAEDNSNEGSSSEGTSNEGSSNEGSSSEDTSADGGATGDTTNEFSSEVTITPDEAAADHLIYQVAVGEDTIEIVLTRREDAPGLAQTTTLTIQIEWFGLKGTICVDMLPYGQTAVDAIVDTEERQVVTGLDPVNVNDTINPENPIACVILNLETLADFKLTFTQASTPLNRVRWSLDGEQYTMLYDSHELTIAWPYPEGFEGLLYLDFGDALAEGQTPSIAVEPTEYGRLEFTPVMESLPALTDPIIRAASLPCTMAMKPNWGDARPVIVGLQRLVTDEEGNLVYADDLSLIPSVTNAGILLTSAQDALHPPSGSYRLLIQWIWNETVVDEQIIYFFVNTN